MKMNKKLYRMLSVIIVLAMIITIICVYKGNDSKDNESGIESGQEEETQYGNEYKYFYVDENNPNTAKK